MQMLTYKIVTFGCQMNLADSGILSAILESRGFKGVESEKEADLIILNTCSVRQKAEERVFGRLGELSALKRDNPDKKLAVVGCMAQRLGQSLLDRAPYVDFVLGTDRLFDLPQYIGEQNGAPLIHTEFGHENIDIDLPARDSKCSAFVTISRGCDNFCTYCIVPYVRGRERSYPVSDLVQQVRSLVEDGVLEVTFLGQNVNSYRDGERDFSDLLRTVAEETGIKRIRFMTSHPKDLSDRLIDTIAAVPEMMPHLHLPLQSGSERILKKMGRVYTYSHYRNLVRRLREAVGEISLTTDLIVGFPSETEDEFRMTLDAVREIGFDSAFMFRYSVREGTAAAQYNDDVSETGKIRRLTELISLQKNISFEKNQCEIGREHSVLVDGVSRRDESVLKGKTGGNKTLLFKADKKYIGTIQQVKVTAADSWTLHGELLG